MVRSMNLKITNFNKFYNINNNTATATNNNYYNKKIIIHR